MTEHRFKSVSDALPHLMGSVLRHGTEMGSRGGDVVKEKLHETIVLEEPQNREITTPHRRAALPAQIAETMWVLAGRDDVGWLSHYLPRAPQFSDDGVVWRGAYGKRLRRWPLRDGSDGVRDQLASVIEILREDPASRRAVMSIFDPVVDLEPGKDIPCNNWIHLSSRLGALHTHVTIRSNDLMWGWSGINAFEWSALQEITAGLLGMNVGELRFSISSLHLYERHWKRAQQIAADNGIPAPRGAHIGFDPRTLDYSLERFDEAVEQWFEVEQLLRTEGSTIATKRAVDTFPEPMLRSWLRVLGYWWTGDEHFRYLLRGTQLLLALEASPKRKTEHPEAEKPAVPKEHLFVKFVSNLHAEKHAAYGDSWKKRGEILGIMANIARKIDRLGVGGAGDTAADTAIDLLVYLAKYRLWLWSHHPGAEKPYPGMKTSEEDRVEAVLVREETRPSPREDTEDTLIQALRKSFSELELMVGLNGEEKSPAGLRADHVDTMINKAFWLARILWEREQRNS